MLALGNQALMNWTGQQGRAVPADLVAEVLAGDADGTGAGGLEDIPFQVVPLFRGDGGSGGHGTGDDTPVLLMVGVGVKVRCS